MVRYQREADNVQLETSLIAQLGTWMESQTGPLRRAIGMPLEEAAQRELAFYAREQQGIIDFLDQGLSEVQDQQSLDAWIARLPPLQIRGIRVIWAISQTLRPCAGLVLPPHRCLHPSRHWTNLSKMHG